MSREDVAGDRSQIYQMPCGHKDFADVLTLVIIVTVHLATRRHGHVVVFSSDAALEALTLIDDYALRFQIKFEFRQAKQAEGIVGEQVMEAVCRLGFIHAPSESDAEAVLGRKRGVRGRLRFRRCCLGVAFTVRRAFQGRDSAFCASQRGSPFGEGIVIH